MNNELYIAIPLVHDTGFAIIDAKNYASVKNHSWRLHTNGYAITGVYGPRMHTLLCNSEHYVDHVNGNKLDNRSHNLRPATKSQNGCNRGAQSNSKTGYKGVNLFKKTGQYSAQIKAGTKRIWLGLHPTKEEAANAYNKAAKLHHGEFAYQNQIEPDSLL